MKKLISIKNLSVSFSMRKGMIYAVQDISFDIFQGETLGIVGESGSGKSVCTKSFAKLLSSPPAKYSGGEIIFEDEDLLKKREKDLINYRGKKIGYIFQDPMTSLNPTMRVGRQILESAKSKERVFELLRLVGIEERKKYYQYPHELSGGERQRVMIAIALASDAKLLIADEPTTALDVTIELRIINLLKDIQKKLNTSIIFISHDLKIVANLADRILVMYAGEKVEEGKTADVIERAKHPYTKLLLQSIPRLFEKSKRLKAIEGNPPSLIKRNLLCPFLDRCPYKMKICREKKPPFFQFEKEQKALCWLYEEGKI